MCVTLGPLNATTWNVVHIHVLLLSDNVGTGTDVFGSKGTQFVQKVQQFQNTDLLLSLCKEKVYVNRFTD